MTRDCCKTSNEVLSWKTCWEGVDLATEWTNSCNSQGCGPWCCLSASRFCVSFPCTQGHMASSPSSHWERLGCILYHAGQVSLRCVWASWPAPSSQDSNSLSLLTEISGVEAPVPLCSVSVLESLASGLARRGEAGSKCGWWRRSWWEPVGELSEGRREGSCCSLR